MLFCRFSLPEMGAIFSSVSLENTCLCPFFVLNAERWHLPDSPCGLCYLSADDHREPVVVIFLSSSVAFRGKLNCLPGFCASQ